MKIINLLNKIANGEEVPKKIKWGVHNFEWFVYKYRAIDELGEPDLFQITDGISETFLNDEVEIIEGEMKMPEKLDHLIGYDIQQFDDLKEYVEITTNDLFGEVNKVIDTLNTIINHLKSKGDE